jgi:hypothetical protein
MSMFEMTTDEVIEWREKYRDLAAPHVNGEEVESAAVFRRGGATASFIASRAQLGGLVYAGVKLFNKKKAGGLPERMLLAVTPDKLYAFDFAYKGRAYRVKKEAAVWDRAGLKIASERRSGMTALTIESPAEGEKATLVGAGISDDPLSQELIATLMGAIPVGV